MKKVNKSLQRYTIIVFVFVISLVVIGVSVSFSFFNIGVDGSSTFTPPPASEFNVTTTLTNATAINAAQLALIDGANYRTEAEKVEFSVTNNSTSEVNANYTIELVEMSMTRNLSSKYFKWALVINPGADEQVITGDFLDTNIGTEGNNNTTEVTGLTKTLISTEDALPLNIGTTDNIEFYIWLENDDIVDQLYLTNGDFSAKLSLNAFPVR